MYWEKVISSDLPHPVTGEERRQVQKINHIQGKKLAAQMFALDEASESPPSHQSRPKREVDSLEELLGEDLEDLIDAADDDQEMRDFVVDDDGAGYLDEISHATGLRKYHERSRQDALKELYKDSNGIKPSYSRPTFHGPDLQEPFQANATPTRGNRRYLCN